MWHVAATFCYLHLILDPMLYTDEGSQYFLFCFCKLIIQHIGLHCKIVDSFPLVYWNDFDTDTMLLRIEVTL